MRALPLLLVVLALGRASAQESWNAEFATEHYHVKTTSDKKHAEILGNHMELVYDTYSRLLNYTKKPDRKFVIKLYKDHAEYKQHGAQGPALAHYSPQSKELVGSWDPDGMLPIMSHEGMHQFTDMVMPDFQKGTQNGEVPTWYSEGLADCIGNCRAKDGKLYMCVITEGYMAHMRTIIVQTAVREGRTPPLKELVTWNQPTFYARNGRLNYAIGWSFTHFLMTYPKIEEPTKQIPDGKYKKVFVMFHNLLASGRKRDEAYAAFGINGGPPAWDRYEKEWKEYVLKFPDPLAGTPIEGLAADIDKLNDNDGVYVGTIKDDAPCAKAGLKSKDVILELDGAPCLHYGKLVPPLRRKKPDDKAVLKIRRGTETIDVTLEWPAPPKK